MTASEGACKGMTQTSLLPSPLPPPLQAAEELECYPLSLGWSPASSPPELWAAEEVEEGGEGAGEH